MLSKKSIVLNGESTTNNRAVLSLECDNENLSGRLRLYGFAKEPNGIISLGIYNDGKVVKAGLTKVSNMLYTFKTDLNCIPNKFSCAVVNFINSEPKPILYGNSEGPVDRNKIFDSVVESLKDADSIEEVENVLDKYDINYDNELQKEIDEKICEEINENDIKMCSENNYKNCENCEYKKHYFMSINKINNIQENINKIDEKINKNSENTEKKEKISNFYLEMKPHIDNLFDKNPAEEYLENIFKDSKFVKVKLDEDNYYVVGLIYDDAQIKYICYGVPGVYQQNPPKELSGYPVWIPIDEDKPQDFGYWITYQDAVNGESVKAIIA